MFILWLKMLPWDESSNALDKKWDEKFSPGDRAYHSVVHTLIGISIPGKHVYSRRASWDKDVLAAT